ncbi:F0F1 ATP synthase subunit A [Streptococcus loxodontisalivarius]|uniref:ATP synthase subunit a n=1 Tax=Streptococcus loxodontisalivarius TaxID=1349415 RepID=A0ABS2PQ33_9STRE|nr:F0F1 ATP synthase subunit A [Streptococcus loxodontisalivarius]MBM7642148.1 F-type H+-transporting ATPase subunit a [Streptococcus loxodontisalivarius]
METTENFTVQFLGIEFDVTILLMSLITVLCAFAFIYFSSRKMSMKPKGKQNLLEFLYEFVQGAISQNLGEYTKNYSLFFFTLFFFVFFANTLGLLTKLELGGYNWWTSPTSNFMIDFGLSLIVALVVHVEGIRKRGLKAYLKSYLGEMPVMMPMNILEQITNVLSLALRLFGNIYSGEIVMSLVLQLASISIFLAPVSMGINLIWTAFSMFIGGIQAYVFIILSSKYVGEKILDEEE